METWNILTDVVLLLGASTLLGGLLERLGQSAVIGYLLAGALLGPHVLHVVEDGEEVLALSEIGVALLLFVIGLEFSWRRLREMGRAALGGGTLQVAATLVLGGLVAHAAGLSPSAAIVLGAALALSSTACVLRVLSGRGELESERGERSLGVLLVQDVAVVPLVLVASVLAEGGTAAEMMARLARAAGLGAALVAGLSFVLRHGVARLLASGPVRANRELSLLVAVVSGLGSAVAAHAAGLSPALGAFVAGLVLADSPFVLQVRAEVTGLKTLLLTLFFSSIGMLSDPRWMAANGWLVAAVLVGVLVGKAALAGLALRTFGVRGPVALAAGIGLAQVGEFSLVLAGIGRGSLLDEQVYALIVSVAVLSMLATPMLVAAAPHVAAWWARHTPARLEVREEDPELPAHIVIGFGPAGRAVARRLADGGRRVVVVDHNPLAARVARELGYSALTGDARYAEVLEHAGIQHAPLAVITVPHAAVARQVIRYAREHSPWTLVLVRARHQRAVPELAAAGAHAVVDEEREVGERLAAASELLLGATGSSRPAEDGSLEEEASAWTGA